MGEPLAEIDTDKATMEMQALGNGVLRKILIHDGESAPLGQLIAIIGEPDEDISSLLAQTEAKQATPETQPAQAASPEAKADAAPAESPTEPNSGNEQTPKTSPAKAAGEKAETQREPANVASGNGAQQSRLIVSPLAARMAAESGIDLRSINGSGPGGRIIKRDIQDSIDGKAAATSGDAGQGAQVQQSPTEPSAYRDVAVSEMRKTIAKRLVTSLGPIPHFFLTTEIEMDRAAEMRSGINALDPELKISVNDIIIKVAAAALRQHPQVNASFQDKVVRYYEHADIGVAVAIEDGLITPIVRSADQKSLSQIASEVRDLAGRARNRKLRPEEFLGATFSISNLGMFGIDEFTAVINPPEGAILAVGAMAPKPVVRGSEIVIRQMMRVTMSCDHRVIDGATGAKFLQTFKKILENPLFLVV